MSKRKVVEQAVSNISPDMNKTQSVMEIVKRMVEQQNSRQEILTALVESGITMKSAPTYLYNTQKKLDIQFRRERETKATRAALIMEEEVSS